jgi:hypothetical protein
MKITTPLLVVLFLLVVAYTPPAVAGDAVATMAKIVSSLKHFPNDADKEALETIAAGDGSGSVKAVASAIAGISHKVGAADKAALEAIAANDAEPTELRELASIVVSINHMPSAEAKTALAALTGE